MLDQVNCVIDAFAVIDAAWRALTKKDDEKDK